MSSPPPSRGQARALLGRRTGIVLAMVMLFARIVAAAPMPAAGEADAVARAALHTICHAAPDGDRAPDHYPAPNSSHDGCLLCPACHLLAHAAVPVPGGPVLPLPDAVLIGSTAPLPPATGPPGRFHPVPHPTGPPASA